MADTGNRSDATGKFVLTEEEWRSKLSPTRFHVIREGGTERAFAGDLWDHHGTGKYVCAGCGQALFESDTKFDSGSGWPSFHSPADDGAVATHEDDSHGMSRVEVLCARCDGHLGHLFPDGPRPTGLRYCINSASLEFEPAAPDDDRE